MTLVAGKSAQAAVTQRTVLTLVPVVQARMMTTSKIVLKMILVAGKSAQAGVTQRTVLTLVPVVQGRMMTTSKIVL